MELNGQQRKATDSVSPSTGLTLRAPNEARILIVCDDDPIAERLNLAFRQAGFISECVKSITAGCASARSGRFQVVFTTPYFTDGSWRRPVDIGNHYDLGFVVILVATTFDLYLWAEALMDGAFEVLDAWHELPNVADSATRAVWAAYLKGARPGGPETANPSKAA